MGWKWPATGTGALAAAVLGDTCWHKSFLEVTASTVIAPADSRTELHQAK